MVCVFEDITETAGREEKGHIMVPMIQNRALCLSTIVYVSRVQGSPFRGYVPVSLSRREFRLLALCLSALHIEAQTLSRRKAQFNSLSTV